MTNCTQSELRPDDRVKTRLSASRGERGGAALRTVNAGQNARSRVGYRPPRLATPAAAWAALTALDQRPDATGNYGFSSAYVRCVK